MSSIGTGHIDLEGSELKGTLGKKPRILVIDADSDFVSTVAQAKGLLEKENNVSAEAYLYHSADGYDDDGKPVKQSTPTDVVAHVQQGKYDAIMISGEPYCGTAYSDEVIAALKKAGIEAPIMKLYSNDVPEKAWAEDALHASKRGMMFEGGAFDQIKDACAQQVHIKI